MHETPFQEHGLMVLLVFHVVSFWDLSEAVLKATSASKSGLVEAWTLRRRRRKWNDAMSVVGAIVGVLRERE